MTRAYGVAVVGGGADSARTAEARSARGRPNWWIVLSVSLALIAVLVATAGTSQRPPRLQRLRALDGHTAAQERGRRPSGATTLGSGQTTTTSTSALAAPPPASPGGGGTSVFSPAAPSVGPTSGSTVTPTTTAPTATTTTTSPLQSTTHQPAARSTQNEGYLDPPLQTSQAFVFTGSGATEVSVIWSGSTYLTMVVSCSNGSQTVGGTSAMQATLPDAAGSCRATVSEPSSESATLTFTITIGPPGG